MTGPWRCKGRTLVPGDGEGRALVLAEPLSLWGGLDPASGTITDRRHPARGRTVSGRVLVLPCGRGSSSASSVLLEAVRAGTAPAAIVLAERDPILALGATVAQELYRRAPPVLVLDGDHYRRLRDGDRVRVEAGGRVEVWPV